jgi:hypothetical protein
MTLSVTIKMQPLAFIVVMLSVAFCTVITQNAVLLKCHFAECYILTPHFSIGMPSAVMRSDVTHNVEASKSCVVVDNVAASASSSSAAKTAIAVNKHYLVKSSVFYSFDETNKM